MTTILGDCHAGVMVSDTAENDGERVWKSRKIFRVRGDLIGAAGLSAEIDNFFAWYRANDGTKPPKFGSSTALILNDKGLWRFDENTPTGPIRVPSGREAIGSGGAAALSAYEGLGWTNPARAVRIACKHDVNSRTPVRSYQLRRTP